jgi:hypothetical protein
VGRTPKGVPLMRSLLKSPVWIAGFVLQFILGTALYTLSVGLVGPAIVPGLMSIGLVVLVAIAVTVTGNLCGIAATWYALANGRATMAIPLQNAVTQVLPAGVFFLVYRPYVPAAESFVFLGAAGALPITGVVLLMGRLGQGEESTGKSLTPIRQGADSGVE